MCKFKKRFPSLCVSREPRRKHRTGQRHKLHRTNHDNFIKLRKTFADTIRFQSDPAGQVINLSTKRFCKDTFKLLNKNLNFVPTQKTTNKDTINKQLEDFFTRIKLRAHFKKNKNKNLSAEEDRFKKPTNKNWIPTNNYHSIETFIEATRNEIQEKTEKARPSKYSNLTIKERKAMQELQSRNDIVITDADKGGAAVILDVGDYVKEAERHLNNKENYRKIIYDPITANNETIHKVISRFQKENLLSKSISEGLKTENRKTSHFYLKPKVHKEGNPGRPVISSISCHTSKISKYVDYHLQPTVKENPSYVQDTTYFLRKINQIDFVPDNSYLVFLDVKLLYANIPIAEGIKSVKTSLENYSKRTASTKVITTFLALILTLNNFIFNCKNYLQIKGSAMGNLHTLIRKHLYGPLRKKIHIPIYQDIFAYIPQVYRRYIFYMDRQ